jgi:antitoxin component of MazEF toxin-antitoxin module
MFTTRLRKIGNSQAVIIPKEELQRLGIPDGATVVVEVRQAEVTVAPILPKHLRKASDTALKWGEEGLRYLADH